MANPNNRPLTILLAIIAMVGTAYFLMRQYLQHQKKQLEKKIYQRGLSDKSLASATAKTPDVISTEITQYATHGSNNAYFYANSVLNVNPFYYLSHEMQAILQHDIKAHHFLREGSMVNPSYLAHLRNAALVGCKNARRIVYAGAYMDIITPLILAIYSEQTNIEVIMIDINQDIQSAIQRMIKTNTLGTASNSANADAVKIVEDRYFKQSFLRSDYSTSRDEIDRLLTPEDLFRLIVTNLKLTPHIQNNQCVFTIADKTIAFQFITADITKLNASHFNTLTKNTPYFLIAKSLLHIGVHEFYPQLVKNFGQPEYALINQKISNSTYGRDIQHDRRILNETLAFQDYCRKHGLSELEQRELGKTFFSQYFWDKRHELAYKQYPEYANFFTNKESSANTPISTSEIPLCLSRNYFLYRGGWLSASDKLLAQASRSNGSEQITEYNYATLSQPK